MTKVNTSLQRRELLRLKSCIRGRVFVEHCPLECGVVTLDHGEAVHAENVSSLDPPGGERVVSSVSVEAGLEPDPGVHQLGPVPRPLTDTHTSPSQ